MRYARLPLKAGILTQTLTIYEPKHIAQNRRPKSLVVKLGGETGVDVLSPLIESSEEEPAPVIKPAASSVQKMDTRVTIPDYLCEEISCAELVQAPSCKKELEFDNDVLELSAFIRFALRVLIVTLILLIVPFVLVYYQ